MEQLVRTLRKVVLRLEELGDLAQERLEDPSYLALVEHGFRTWDEAVTESKRD